MPFTRYQPVEVTEEEMHVVEEVIKAYPPALTMVCRWGSVFLLG